jgi:hypothetical protein
MNKSPKVKKEVKKQLTFQEAITEILMGNSVTKEEWGDKAYYGILDGERLRLHKPNGTLHDWLLSEGDMRGDDFYVIT